MLYNILFEQKNNALNRIYVYKPNIYKKTRGLYNESEILDYKTKEILNIQNDKNLFLNKDI